MSHHRYHRPPFHPYGFASTGKGSLALIRIPKNASSSFVASFSLNDWTHTSRLTQYEIFCAVRDPVVRFLSSIVETTMRARLFQDDRFFGDIVIDPKIYFDMQHFLRAGKITCFLSYMIDVIEHTGPMDAHHERQVRFLEDFTPHLHKIAFFDVADTDAVIHGLLKRHTGSKVDANRLRDSKRVVSRSARFRALHQELQHRFMTKPLSPRHLILPVQDGENQPRFRSKAFDQAIQDFNQSIQSAATSDIRSRITKLYALDCELHAQVAVQRGCTWVTALP